MKKSKTFHLNKHLVKKVPQQIWIILGVVFASALIYGAVFLIPKQVTFAYAGENCVDQLTLFPGIHAQSSEQPFRIELGNRLTIGPLAIASTKACFTPSAAFNAGDYSASTAPWSGPVFQKRFSVNVPDAPIVLASAADKGSISAVKPLEITLAAEDTLHTYTLTRGDASIDCQSAGWTLTCPIAELSLDHGQEYTLSLTRHIPGLTESEPVTAFTFATLTPVAVTQMSVGEGQIVYDTPKEFIFSTDKPLKDAKVSLALLKGEEVAPVAHTFAVTATGGTIVPEAPLERKAQYILTITELDGVDGSSLAEPYTVRFATSGGPKVSSTSIGSSQVAQSARITINLDQPLDETVDVTKFTRITGASAVITKVSPTQIAVTLQSAPLCAAFTITVDKGMKSGSNGTLGEEVWKIDSRVICGTSSTIGYSVKGRAIVAYYFGSGASTILFTGGIHGSEGSSTTTMQAWVNYLQANGHKIPADKRVVVVPNVNPDGIAAGTRNNANNVNLARNFPSSNWKADIQTANGELKNGGGTSPASEPEAKTLLDLTRQLRPRLQVSFHAQGRLVGANKYSDSISIGNTYAGLVGYKTMFYNAEEVMGYEITGEYEEWMGEELGAPAILIELPSYTGNYLNSQLTALLRMLTV